MIKVRCRRADSLDCFLHNVIDTNSCSHFLPHDYKGVACDMNICETFHLEGSVCMEIKDDNQEKSKM
jgi:hypothetical protein